MNYIEVMIRKHIEWDRYMFHSLVDFDFVSQDN